MMDALEVSEDLENLFESCGSDTTLGRGKRKKRKKTYEDEEDYVPNVVVGVPNTNDGNVKCRKSRRISKKSSQNLLNGEKGDFIYYSELGKKTGTIKIESQPDVKASKKKAKKNDDKMTDVDSKNTSSISKPSKSSLKLLHTDRYNQQKKKGKKFRQYTPQYTPPSHQQIINSLIAGAVTTTNTNESTDGKIIKTEPVDDIDNTLHVPPWQRILDKCKIRKWNNGVSKTSNSSTSKSIEIGELADCQVVMSRLPSKVVKLAKSGQASTSVLGTLIKNEQDHSVEDKEVSNWFNSALEREETIEVKKEEDNGIENKSRDQASSSKMLTIKPIQGAVVTDTPPCGLRVHSPSCLSPHVRKLAVLYNSKGHPAQGKLVFPTILQQEQCKRGQPQVTPDTLVSPPFTKQKKKLSRPKRFAGISLPQNIVPRLSPTNSSEEELDEDVDDEDIDDEDFDDEDVDDEDFDEDEIDEDKDEQDYDFVTKNGFKVKSLGPVFLKANAGTPRVKEYIQLQQKEPTTAGATNTTANTSATPQAILPKPPMVLSNSGGVVMHEIVAGRKTVIKVRPPVQHKVTPITIVPDHLPDSDEVLAKHDKNFIEKYQKNKYMRSIGYSPLVNKTNQEYGANMVRNPQGHQPVSVTKSATGPPITQPLIQPAKTQTVKPIVLKSVNTVIPLKSLLMPSTESHQIQLLQQLKAKNNLLKRNQIALNTLLKITSLGAKGNDENDCTDSKDEENAKNQADTQHTVSNTPTDSINSKELASPAIADSAVVTEQQKVQYNNISFLVDNDGVKRKVVHRFPERLSCKFVDKMVSLKKSQLHHNQKMLEFLNKITTAENKQDSGASFDKAEGTQMEIQVSSKNENNKTNVETKTSSAGDTCEKSSKKDLKLSNYIQTVASKQRKNYKMLINQLQKRTPMDDELGNEKSATSSESAENSCKVKTIDVQSTLLNVIPEPVIASKPPPVLHEQSSAFFTVDKNHPTNANQDCEAPIVLVQSSGNISTGVKKPILVQPDRSLSSVLHEVMKNVEKRRHESVDKMQHGDATQGSDDVIPIRSKLNRQQPRSEVPYKYRSSMSTYDEKIKEMAIQSTIEVQTLKELLPESKVPEISHVIRERTKFKDSHKSQPSSITNVQLEKPSTVEKHPPRVEKPTPVETAELSSLPEVLDQYTANYIREFRNNPRRYKVYPEARLYRKSKRYKRSGSCNPKYTYTRLGVYHHHHTTEQKTWHKRYRNAGMNTVNIGKVSQELAPEGYRYRRLYFRNKKGQPACEIKKISTSLAKTSKPFIRLPWKNKTGKERVSIGVDTSDLCPSSPPNQQSDDVKSGLSNNDDDRIKIELWQDDMELGDEVPDWEIKSEYESEIEYCSEVTESASSDEDIGQGESPHNHLPENDDPSLVQNKTEEQDS